MINYFLSKDDIERSIAWPSRMSQDKEDGEMVAEEDAEVLDYEDCIDKIQVCRKNFGDYIANMERHFQTIKLKLDEAFQVAYKDFKHYRQSLEDSFEASEQQCLQRLEIMKKHQNHYGNMLHVLNEFREQSSMLDRLKK